VEEEEQRMILKEKFEQKQLADEKRLLKLKE
jgi:hypothetical protein